MTDRSSLRPRSTRLGPWPRRKDLERAILLQPRCAFVTQQRATDLARIVAQAGTAKGELMMALNDKLNARIDEEVGDDNGKFLPLIAGYWYPARA